MQLLKTIGIFFLLTFSAVLLPLACLGAIALAPFGRVAKNRMRRN